MKRKRKLRKASNNLKRWLLETAWGWCGLVTENNAVIELVLPSLDKKLILKRLNPAGNNLVITVCGAKQAIPFNEKALVLRIRRDLNKYFNGEKVDFSYKISLRGYTNFEQSVYHDLMDIPYGQVRNYGWLADKTGHPKAGRAVGNALAKNPLPLLIPCHRIIKSNGSLGNFSAIGGARLKEKLLKLEKTI